MKSIDKSAQSSPEPTVYEDSCIQTHVSGTDKCVQSGPSHFSNITQISALKPDMKKLSDDVKYLNTTDPEHFILCPCCDRSMTTDHECEPEIDQKDNIVASNASTQNQSNTDFTQPTPDPPVQNLSTPNPQPNQYPDATIERLAAYMTSQNNLLLKKLFPGSPPT